MSKTFLIAALLAVAEARFGQEQSVASVISGLSSFGNPGEAATLAGGTPGVLLAGANACDKLTLADKIVTTLGNDPQVIAGAAKLVAAEKNFNPFAVSIPSLCSDPSLPATAELRGIVPLVDPAVTGSDVENANSAKSLTTPFDATGLSVADVAKAQGFTNFTSQAASGATTGGATGGGAATGGGSSSNNSTTTPASSGNTAAASNPAASCGGSGAAAAPAVNASSSTGSSTTSDSGAAASGAASSGSGSSASGVQQSSIAGLDFGLCVPTMKFEAGLNGRKDTEFTFQAIDGLVNKGQEEALNPNIITNRICDQLTNVCQANDAAKTACLAAKIQISGLGTRDKSTADAWNTALGFAGTNTNPDNAPQAGLVGHT